MFTLPIQGLGPNPNPKPILRRRRRLFVRPDTPGRYRLPRSLQERLLAALAAFRNAETGFTLATFLGRFWSAPGRINQPFPIDRRALADHRDLRLTEGQIRGAIQTLEKIGFLVRQPPENGRRFQRTADGFQRKPILFRFGPDYADGFARVAKRPRKAKERRLSRGRIKPPVAVKLPSAGLTEALSARLPINKVQILPKGKILMGQVAKEGLPTNQAASSESDSALESAIQRWHIALMAQHQK